MSDDDWNIVAERFADNQGEEYVGTFRQGAEDVMMFYDGNTRRMLERGYDADQRQIDPEPNDERHLDDESLGEVIEDLGDSLGWESLSEFAEKHLESDNDS